jgi:hypothetical protein
MEVQRITKSLKINPHTTRPFLSLYTPSTEWAKMAQTGSIRP